MKKMLLFAAVLIGSYAMSGCNMIKGTSSTEAGAISSEAVQPESEPESAEPVTVTEAADAALAADHSDDSTDLNNRPESEGYDEDTVAAETITEPEAMLQWKQLYYDYIQENQGNHEQTSYYLVYINDDTIPEIVINYGSIAGGGKVVTACNDTLDSVHTYDYGFSYEERNNLFLDSGGHMDQYYDAVYHILNGRIEQLFDGEYLASYNPETEEWSYEYFISGTPVTEEEYQQKLEALADPSELRSPYEQGGYSYDEVLLLLTGAGKQ